MKKIFLLLFIALYPIISFSNASLNMNITIDEYKTDVYFANGILTDEGNATANTILLKRAIQKDTYDLNLSEYKKHIGKVKEAYNETHFAGLGDLLESLVQKLGIQGHIDDIAAFFSPFSLLIFETSHSRNIETQINAYKTSIQSGHKVLVVAHSQGNLFTYEAREKLLFETHQGWMSDYFEVVSIASPAMFSIPGNTPLISWDNDFVAWLGIYNGSMVDNPVRKIDWEPMREEIGLTTRAQKPTSNYIRKPQVGQLYGADWKSYEDVLGKFDSTVHAFTFYMGEDLGEGKILNPFDDKPLQTDKAKNKIMKAIKSKLNTLEKVESQWEKTKDIGCLCKDKRIKVAHKFDSGLNILMDDQDVYDFDEAGKIYKIGDGYVRAKFGGVKIEEINEEEACYVLSDDVPKGLGKVKGLKEHPKTKDGVVEIFLDWNNSELDYDLIVEWDAGEVDVKDIGCPKEHFYIKNEREIYPGTYRVSIVPKDGSDEIFEDESIYPFEVDLVTRTPGASDKMHFVIKKREDITLGHVSDIKVFRVDGDNDDNKTDPDIEDTSPFIIVPDIAPECPEVQRTPSPVQPRLIYFNEGTRGGWSYHRDNRGGTTGGNTSRGGVSFTPQQDPGCGGDVDCLPTPGDNNNNSDISGDPYAPPAPIAGGQPVRDLEKEDNCTGNESCGCIPCEYEIIPYLKQIYFGPLRDANFSIYSLDTYVTKNSIFDGKTTNGETLYDAGEIDVPQVFLNTLADDKLYIIEAEGGEDIDSNDDFIIDANPTKNLGKVYAIASGKDIKYTGFKVNILTTVTFELVKEMVENGSSETEIENKISDIASRLLAYKVYSNAVDTNITNVDLLAWLPTVDKDLLLQSYAPLEEMAGKIYAGEDIYNEAYEYVYFRPKEINGTTLDDPEATVVDENNPPVIKVFTGNINEDAVGGTIVGKIDVLRGSSDISFGELSGKGSEVFEVNSEGEIKLRTDSTLDYETKWLYKLKVEAFNKKGSSGQVGVYISVKNVLDAPEYIKFEGGLVDENITAGTKVGQLFFIEGASPITSIEMQGESKDLFTIDNNGTIRLAIGETLDYEEKYSYGFVVVAKNSYGSSMPVILYINIRDIADSPRITNYTGGYVHEDANAGTFVGQVVYDQGGSSIDTISLEGEGSQNFTVDINGILHVSSTAELDYESYALYQPTVTVSNSYGSATRRIFISVVDTKDVPSFISFSGGNVKENSSAGTVVGQVVFDPGSMPIDSIVMSGEGSENFKILENGTLVVADDTLNYEEKDHYVVKVTASNALGSSVEVTVHIFVDDVFEQMVVLEDFVVNNIEENLPVGTVIGKIELSSTGEGNITGFVLEGEGSEDFSIDINGTIRVTKVLDYETKREYMLSVIAQSTTGGSQPAHVRIDLKNIPEHPPVFKPFNGGIQENAAIGTSVGKAEVETKGDTPIIIYDINGTDMFDIDENGTIIAKQVFDYENKTSYRFKIRAKNSAGYSEWIDCLVEILDMYDTVPALSNFTELYVDENATAGTVVGKVSIISQGDSFIKYFKVADRNDQQNIEYEWPKGYFSVDSNGTIRVGKNASLDYESKRNYSAYIVAVNESGESKKGYVQVSLNNIIDTPPSCQGSTVEVGPVSKSTLIGMEIKSIYCNNGDSHMVSAKLEPDSPFEAVISKGNYISDDRVLIRLKSLLENAKTYEYNLTLSVSNKAGKSNKLPIHIIIDRNNYVFEMHQGNLNKILGKINTGDKTVSYIRTDNSYFSVDKNGTVSRNDRENTGEYKPQYTFKVTITYDDWSNKEITVVVNVQSRILAQLAIPEQAAKIILNEARSRAYIISDNPYGYNNSHGMEIVNIKDPYKPKIISSIVTDGKTKDIVLSKDENYIYLLDAGKGLKVIDIRDENKPQTVSSLAFSGPIYQFGDIDLSEDGNTLFMAHGTYGIEVIDISDPLYPEIRQNIGFLGTLEYDGNNYNYKDLPAGGYSDIVSDDDMLYSVDRNYGLQVIDISDLENPVSIYAESLKNGKYSYSATDIYLHKEEKLISVLSTDDLPMTLYNIENNSDINKIKQDYTLDEIELFDKNIAYRANYTLSIYDAYDPIDMTKMLYLNLGQTYGMVLDKERNIAFVANGNKGLTVVDVTGIKQPVHHEPVIAGTTINIAEENIASITVNDVFGNIPILKTGDTPIMRMWTDQPKYKWGGPDCGNTYHALPVDQDCEDDYNYFNVDENGNIYINDSSSLAYESIGNMAPFAIYAENDNGYKSKQAKVMLNIVQNPDWSIQFQRPVIKIDNNISAGATIANVLQRKSQRTLQLFDIYKYIEYECNANDIRTYNSDYDGNYSYAEIITNLCTKPDYFDINTNGDITISETPPEGNYSVNIFAIDRFGLKGLDDLKIEVVSP